MKLSEDLLSRMWIGYDWEKAENYIIKLQKQLTIATFYNRYNEIKKLSYKITHSIDAKALAVKKISEELNSTPGIDNIRWIKSSDKMSATLSLDEENYKAKPFKRIYIHDTKSNKERVVNIPTVSDRAMQILQTYALEPISEALADRKSFAFRKGRSTFDVHSCIMDILNESNAPRYVLVADVKSFYDSISHKWLLNNIPMNKKVLKEFIRTGSIFNNEVFPNEAGISLGNNISTILGNMVLDGIQKLIYDLQDSKNIDYSEGYSIRFADDIIIMSRTHEMAEKYLKELKSFVAERGLKLSPTKTQIVSVLHGFEFLSRFYYWDNGVVHSIPSEKAVKSFENELYNLIFEHDTKWSQKGLIQSLNAKLNGWASYHRITEATQAFKRIDNVVSALLLKYVKKLHPNKEMNYLIKKYWYKDENGRNIFTLTTNVNIRVICLEDTILVKHKKVDYKKNIFLDNEYFENRDENQKIAKVSGKYKNIWLRQNGVCYFCNKKINSDQPRKLIFKDLSSKDTSTRNMVYIHEVCTDNEIVFANYDISSINEISIKKIIRQIPDPEIIRISTKSSKYSKLYEYFALCKKYTFNITFEDLEKIIGNKMCNSLYKYKSYWYQKNDGLISSCWLDNGYAIKKIYLKEKKVTFIRTKKQTSRIDIPPQLLSSTIPKSAKHEIEHFFNYIIKKYNL